MSTVDSQADHSLPSDVVTETRPHDELQWLRDELAAGAARLDAYKDRVRETAIRIRREQGDWCLNGLNEVLAGLDLEPHRPGWEVTVNLRARFDFVRATSADDAVNQVRQHLGVLSLSGTGERLVAEIKISDTNAMEEYED